MKVLNKFKDKKVMAIIIVLVIILLISIATYGKNKKSVFKDEYMKNIFIEENDNIDEDEYEMENDKDNNLISNSGESKNVVNKTVSKIVVEIKGEVKNPDVYTLDEGSIIKDVIEVAGGLTTEADISNINRAKEIKNHELIVIRNINDVALVENDINYIGEVEEDDGKISINTADISKLKEIPGIGEAKANAIISYRERNNGFKSVDELKNVDGIGEKIFESIKSIVKL